MIKHVPIALQLFAVRGECDRDLPSTLNKIAEIGYVGAEPWGYDGQDLSWKGYPAQTLRQMFDDNGLFCCGIHLSTDALLGDNLARTIEFNQILGNRFLIIAADKQRTSTLNGVHELAEILNQVAETLHPLGMRTGYHAHGFDFVRHGDQTAWEILFSRTTADVVMQLDIGNCASGGGDPIAMLKAFPGRAKSVHLKDYGREPGTPLGSGQADWQEILDLCDTLHHPLWYVVEEGHPDGLGFDIPAQSLRALREMGR